MTQDRGPDLSLCEQEPIRIPGAIQPHGWLLVLDGKTLALLAHGANWHAEQAAQARAALPLAALEALTPETAPVTVGEITLDDPTRLSATAHRTAQHVIVEFEAAAGRELGEAPIYSLSRIFLPRLQQAGEVLELAALAAEEMKRLTGFGRCLVYRFDEAGHGEVLAEQIDEGYDSYSGHHFPASDIPQQARDLYVLNQFRLIPEANYTPVPLVCIAANLAPAAIDLSQAQLRSVSPVHLEYMRHMGTRASMSVSIVIGGKLWGLISCHDHGPRHLSAAVRRACEHMGQLLALQIQAKEANQRVSERLELRKITLELVSHLSEGDATLARLVREPALLLKLARASGAAVVLDEQIWSTGEVPADEDIQALAQWISGLGREIYDSRSVAHVHAEGGPVRGPAGVLAISISQVHRHLVMWFRPEVVQTVTWAGDPRKAPMATDGRIHPRRSFASWVEHVSGQSEPWTDSQRQAAGELRQALIGIVLRRAEELAAVASELGRVNKELEAFSYTVSHDLRAPMRHIAGYVDLVVELEGKKLGERSTRYLGHVKDAAAFAGQLVDALLDFSRLGRAALKRRMVNTATLIEGLVQELSRIERDRKVEWIIAPDLPVLYADPLLLQVAVRNLMSNALKYSRARAPAQIRIEAVRTEAGEGLQVRDNGVGFQMKYVDKLFGVFQRLHQAEDFEGTGIGLANVKRIVERHGGTVWALGQVDQGASFGFTLPQAPADDALPAANGEEKHA